tara:strand:- start:1017 stop:1211 length:195 start_codon:yes stop_codon:yes gene_type:complete
MFNIDTIRNTVFGELGDNVQLYFDIEGILVAKDVIYVGVIRWHQDNKHIEQNMYKVIEEIKAQM